MKTTMSMTLSGIAVVLVAILIWLLFLAVMHSLQDPMASVGWHQLATVSWNG